VSKVRSDNVSVLSRSVGDCWVRLRVSLNFSSVMDLFQQDVHAIFGAFVFPRDWKSRPSLKSQSRKNRQKTVFNIAFPTLDLTLMRS